MPAPACHDRVPAAWAPLIAISPGTHYRRYHDWQKALTFCRDLPDSSPQAPVTFHMFRRQRRAGVPRKRRPFGRKQSLPVKAFFDMVLFEARIDAKLLELGFAPGPSAWTANG
jgi:hypothetical protein